MEKRLFGRKNAIMLFQSYNWPDPMQYFGNIRPFLEQSSWLILVDGLSILVG